MSTTADEPIREGRDVYAPDGTKLGTISKVYPPAGASDETWIAVDAGVADGPYFVPSDGAGTFSEGLQVRHSTEDVQGSPRITVGDDLTDAQIAELSEYYGVMERTSLVPGAPKADGFPVGHARTARRTTAGGRDSGADTGTPVADTGTDVGEAPDRLREPGTVTVSGADGDVDIDESERLRASRAAARAAAGHPADPGADH
jgi:hypothetical protein